MRDANSGEVMYQLIIVRQIIVERWPGRLPGEEHADHPDDRNKSGKTVAKVGRSHARGDRAVDYEIMSRTDPNR